MIYREIKELLPREPDENLQEVLTKFSFLVDSTINFGTNLLKWDLDKKRSGDENIIPVLFFRNLLEIGDSISILIRNSSIDPCKNLLRSLLENMYEMEYLLEKNTCDRALSYIVWKTYKELKLCEKLDSSTHIGKQFKAEFGKDKLMGDKNSLVDNPVISLVRSKAENLLKITKYKPIVNEFQKTADKIKNPNWFSLYSGPRNIEQLAKYLNHHGSYEILYRGFSGNVHSTNIFKSKLVQNNDGSIAIIQMRYAKDAQSVTLNTLNLLIYSLRIYYQSRLPEKENDYIKWYSEIREPFNQITSLEILNFTD